MNYRNVTDEDIKKVCVVGGNDKQIYIIHEFKQGNNIDYIVIGKMPLEYHNYVADRNFVQWLVLTRNLITMYKSDEVNKKGLRNY